MIARGWSIPVGGALALLVLSQCTLLTGRFDECDTDADCADGRICAAASPGAGERYCVLQTLPAGCQGLPAAGIAAMYGPADAGNAIHIGAAYNFTAGDTLVSHSRVQHLNAVVLALEEINQRGVSGRPFVLHVCDTQNNLDLLRTQVTWMAEELRIPAVLITSSSHVLAAASVTVPRGVLLLSPTATSNEVTSLPASTDGGTRLVWRTVPPDTIQGKVISDLLLGTSSYDAGLGDTRRVGILYVNDPYGQGLSTTLFTALNGKKSLGSFPYPRGGPDMSGPVSQLDSFDPDVTVLVGFADDAARILLSARSSSNLTQNAGHRWFFTDAAKDPLLLREAPAGSVEGQYGTAAAQGAGSGYAIFSNAFRSRFGVDPNNYTFLANNYDALYVLSLGSAYALGASGSGALTGERIAQGLTRLSSGNTLQLGPAQFTQAAAALGGGSSINIEGTSGKLDFDPATGEAPAPIELWQVQNGAIRTAATIEPQP